MNLGRTLFCWRINFILRLILFHFYPFIFWIWIFSQIIWLSLWWMTIRNIGWQLWIISSKSPLGCIFSRPLSICILFGCRYINYVLLSCQPLLNFQSFITFLLLILLNALRITFFILWFLYIFIVIHQYNLILYFILLNG